MESNSRPPLSLEATHVLLAHAQTGDRASLEELFSRCAPRLNRWFSGRVSADPSLRHLAQTSDLVQDVLTRVYENMNSYRETGTPFVAYLRCSMENAIKDLRRKARHRPSPRDPDGTAADPGPSPLQEYEGSSDFERFDEGFAKLDVEERAVIFFRFEMGLDYDELAPVLGRPNADAVRAFYSRSLTKLRGHMKARK